MKKLALVLFLSVFTISLNAQESSTGKQDGPAFKFEHETIDYGKIVKGSNGERSFVFTNVGNAPLIIERVQGSCGCTVPKYPKNVAIKPGGNGEIEVNFDSNGRPNLQQKMIKVSANTPEGGQLLRIQAFVEPKNN